MNLLIYLIVAAVIGWVATEIMHDRSNLLINIIVAVVGAFLAGYLLSPIFNVGTINDAITIPTMLVTLLGSVILLAIVNLFQRKGIFMKFNRNIGFLLLAIWLILTGLSAFISMGNLGTILAILAIAAGVFILLDR
jgi:uncharacterized membrane protein YeaQ/YmgE (transglycosylase-associated protein family)